MCCRISRSVRGKISQHFVAQAHIAIIKGMLVHKIGRQGNTLWIVGILSRRCARVVRRRKSQIQKERIVLFISIQKINSGTAKKIDRKPIAHILLLVRILARRVKIVQRHLVVIAHAAKEYIGTTGKTARKRSATIVPLTRAKSMIPHLAEGLGQEHLFWIEPHQIAIDIHTTTHRSGKNEYQMQ